MRDMKLNHEEEVAAQLPSQILPVTARGAVLAIVLILSLCLLSSACASVDVIQLTSEKFPPKHSAEDVAILEQEPTRPHLELAELRISDDWLSFATLQHRVLARAAALGADAVVFSHAQTETLQEATYEPLFNPWDFNNPYYEGSWSYGGYGGLFGGWDPWWGGNSGSIAVPYDVTINMLTGVAIVYTDVTEVGDRRGSEESSLRRVPEKGPPDGAAASSQ